MKENENENPLLDLSPKLKRPLSLWNPLDYLRLIFWAFFFPQAIRWYVETFGNADSHNKKGLNNSLNFIKAVWGDPVLRKLILQPFVIILITALGICFILAEFNVSINWTGLVIGVTLGVFDGLGFVFSGDLAKGVALGVMLGVAYGVALGLSLGISLGLSFGLVVSLKLGLSVGFNLGVDGVVGVVGGMRGGMVRGVMGGVVGGVVGGMAFGVAQGVALSISLFIISIRLSEYFMTTIYYGFFPRAKKTKYSLHLSRMVFLPLPGVQEELENRLDADWELGVQHANQLLAYSRQCIPVVKAIKLKLDQSSRDILLPRVSAIAINPVDWKLLPALSEIPIDLYWIPILTPRLDTPAHACCAGFWYWHEEESAKAVEAFSIVQDLPHGPELYGIALAIDEGINAGDMQSIAGMEDETQWLGSLPDPELRPGTLKALRILHSTAAEARVALNARAPLNRSTAINRAVADLTKLIETGDSFCPEPEWPLVRDIAKKWNEIFSREGGAIGEEVLRQPAHNPYEGYSGLPVTGSSFAGRTGIMSKIETLWAVGGLMPVLILYGHRRMGKTSVLRNLAKNIDTNNLYVYLDMQNAGWIEHTGQLLLDFAEAVHKAVSQSIPAIGPVPDGEDYSDLDTARRSFNRLLETIDKHMTQNQRLILAIDEFELIETGIGEKRIDPGLLSYLRSVNQEYRWLGLIFAGLHTLDEMGRDYRSAFYGQAKYLRLGYLSRDDALKLITQPHPDFSLEYHDALFDEIYRLTFGQPYLVQLLCWELVNRWNERFLEKGESTPRILKADDLTPVLTPDFYRGAGYYFEGVWGNADENEQHLMRVLAKHDTEPLSRSALEAEAAATGFPPAPEIMEETLQLLLRHDIITETDAGYRFASELMRRWTARRDQE